MARTPGMLNPDSFESKLELRKALFKQGLLAGWTPMSKVLKVDKDDEPVPQTKKPK